MKGSKEMTQVIIDCYSKTELIREGKCTCLTCKHIRQITKLIPNEKLRNKVLEVTNGLYEAMASESMDLGMEVIAKDKEIKELRERIVWMDEHMIRKDE